MAGASVKERRTIYAHGGISDLQALSKGLGELNTNSAEALLIWREQSTPKP